MSEVFSPGTSLTDAYSGRTYRVRSDGNVDLDPRDEPVVLLERTDAAPSTFSWDNATVYFALIDRFENGEPSNDQSYGRQAPPGQTVGTWHGGDFAGIVERLDHLEALGVNALWISPPVEQVHGVGRRRDRRLPALGLPWILGP
ncbi:MAG: hypothetical protein HC927_10730 [Deltaproteobacteria bacterium]|nr:hypothetical protein [Deltaproteobacteria bacterium]